MKTTLTISAVVLFLGGGSSLALYRPPPYSARVRYVTEKQREIPDEPVYIGPSAWIAREGAYALASNRTIGALVKSAGGFTRDEKVRGVPSRYVYPDVVRVFRPTTKEPDPSKPMFVFWLDWSKANGGIDGCGFELQARDLVDVRPKWTLE